MADEIVKGMKASEPEKGVVDYVTDDNVVLDVRHLKKYFPIATNFFGKPTRFLKAVDDVSFKVTRGKTLGIVGESGCGKTTMGRCILRLHEITAGDVFFGDYNIRTLSNKEMQKFVRRFR